MSVVLGVNAVFHDPAAALVIDGEIVAAAEEERFSRRKHGKSPVPFSTWELPERAISWCLEQAGLGASDLDAVGYSYDPDVAPVALMHNLKHNKVLHEKNVILTVRTTDRPRVPEAQRALIEPINDDFKKITLSYGFMESPVVPRALGQCRKQGVKFDIMSTSFFLGRRSVIPSANQGMPLWQDKLYIFLMRNAANPTDFFHIPPGRVVELGTQVSV
jgi:K+ transporter